MKHQPKRQISKSDTLSRLMKIVLDRYTINAILTKRKKDQDILRAEAAELRAAFHTLQVDEIEGGS